MKVGYSICFVSDQDQDAGSSSSSISIFNDPSSDEYVPDSGIISDSEDEYTKSANISSSRRFLSFRDKTNLQESPSRRSNGTAKQHPRPDGEGNMVNQEIPTASTNRPIEDTIVSSSSDTDEDSLDVELAIKKQKMTRKRQRNIQLWKSIVAAKARESGESYLSRKGVVIPAKRINEDSICNEKCRLKFSTTIDKDKRIAIFNDYYKHDINGENVILFKSISKSEPQRKRKGAIRHKTASFKYAITVEGNHIPVCKSALISLYK
ncbi:hypothetical protein J6590_074248 [Homalodisca vitripennis]|nr:hypothetical protein J6590_074248 [Homalodisca vitripennis]